jgi:hypothetical protein
MTYERLDAELKQGGKFVIYYYAVSFVIMTLRRGSSVYYVAPGKRRVVVGLPWTMLSLVVGWWGIPWGPIYTVHSLWVNLNGGKDVTNEIVAALMKSQQVHPSPAHAAEAHPNPLPAPTKPFARPSVPSAPSSAPINPR